MKMKMKVVMLFFLVCQLLLSSVSGNYLSASALQKDETIKKHPAIGYRMLVGTSEFSNIAEGVLSHHERWDGKGYPKGIKGNEIPIEARIIAIADAYDAMTSSRPYRKVGMSLEKARQELINGAGTQFDPEIIQLMIKEKLI